LFGLARFPQGLELRGGWHLDSYSAKRYSYSYSYSYSDSDSYAEAEAEAGLDTAIRSWWQ
jgi:hypothetical protein